MGPLFSVISLLMKKLNKVDVAFTTESVKTSVALRISGAMETRGITKKELCKKAGIKKKLLNKILSSDANFRIDDLSKILMALGYDLGIYLAPPRKRPRLVFSGSEPTKIYNLNS
jgi:transcriptional regulator with XRE-family HTH domain